MIYHLLQYIFAGRHYAYENPVFRATLALVFCFFFMLIVLPPVIKELIRLKIGDTAEYSHAALNAMTKDKKDVPTMGGLVILASIFSAVFLLADLTNFYMLLAGGVALWLGVLGVVDDWFKLTGGKDTGSRSGLKMYEKLLFQVSLGVVIGAYIYKYGDHNYAILGYQDDPERLPAFQILSVPFYKHGLILGPILFMVITVLVMSATSNAVNLTDGMDGLAAGCVSICIVVFAVLTQIAGKADVADKLLFPHVPRSAELVVLCGAMLGSCLGFLWYNCYPARVFMGDTGSLPLGGLIGYIAIVLRQELMLVIVGGIFVAEALSVLIQMGYFKWTRGKRVFRCAPIHHHFRLAGWEEPKIVVRFWLVAIICAACALLTVKLR